MLKGHAEAALESVAGGKNPLDGIKGARLEVGDVAGAEWLEEGVGGVVAATGKADEFARRNFFPERGEQLAADGIGLIDLDHAGADGLG